MTHGASQRLPDRLRSGTAGWLVWSFTRLVGILGLHGLWPYHTAVSSGSDVNLYANWSWLLWHGSVPYRNFELLYPPGVLPLLALPARNPAGYAAEFVAVSLVADAAVFWMLRRSGRTRGMWLWVAAAPLLGPLFWARFDVFVAALLVAALVAMERRRFALAGSCIAMAGLVKLWPLVLIVIFLPAIGRASKRRFVISAGLTSAAFVLPVVGLGGGGGLYSLLRLESGRGVEVEALWALPLNLMHALHVGSAPASVTSWEFHGAASTGLVAASTLVLVVGLLWCSIGAAAWWRPDAPTALLLIVTVVVLCAGKVLSPQYLVWAAAAVCLQLDRTRRPGLLAGWAMVLLLVTQVVYPFELTSVVNGTVAGAAWTVIHALSLVGFAVVAGGVTYRQLIVPPAVDLVQPALDSLVPPGSEVHGSCPAVAARSV